MKPRAEDRPELTDDLLVGVKNIAAYLNVSERKIYWWGEQQMIPLFKIGSVWAGKKSTIARHFEKLESGEAA